MPWLTPFQLAYGKTHSIWLIQSSSAKLSLAFNLIIPTPKKYQSQTWTWTNIEVWFFLGHLHKLDLSQGYLSQQHLSLYHLSHSTIIDNYLEKLMLSLG